MEDSEGNMIAKNMTKIEISHLAQSISLMKNGLMNRKTSETVSNRDSSRSHCLCTLELIRITDGDSFISSKMHLVDLAGYLFVRK